MTNSQKLGTDVASTTFAMTFAGGDASEIINATLRYSVFEPFAVTATFSMADGPGVDWVLARNLLREGIVMPSGLGDVKLYPTATGILLELHSPNGRAILEGPVQPLIDFVRDIYCAVPEGQEGQFFSVDAELDMLAHLAGPGTDQGRDAA